MTEIKNGLVTAVWKNAYGLRIDGSNLRGELSGKLQFGAESSLDLPTVGDRVQCLVPEDATLAIIQEIQPRTTLLKRKAAGQAVEFQPLAANLDGLLVVMALTEDFNLNRLDRYLVLAAEAKIPAAVLLSKADLVTTVETANRQQAVTDRYPELAVLVISNATGKGIDELAEHLPADQTFCLLGSSGVGKSSLINRLTSRDDLATGAVRETDGRGRHVTTTRQMFQLANGAWLIDSPGLRELGNFDLSTGLDDTFADITALAVECRFNDCTHRHEAGCAVQAAVDSGELGADRLANYQKIQREADYYDRSYHEQRRRDKDFGKMVKQVKKHLKQNTAKGR